MKHFVKHELVSRRVAVLLVGAGGSGSRMLEALVNLHRALLAKGHPAGLHVLVVDPDTVSSANVGRQAFYPSDVGSYKSLTLVNRANMALGDTAWQAGVHRIDTKTKGFGAFDIVIGAVDSRKARLAILRAMERAGHGTRYYLDMGNRASDGQVVLGQVVGRVGKHDSTDRLPHVGELFPDLIDSDLDKVEDDIPSCSLAEALEKQSLYVNQAMSLFASNLLWQLLTDGEIEHHGAFINLKAARVLPLEIDKDVWSRFGVTRDGTHRKVQRQSRKEKAVA